MKNIIINPSKIIALLLVSWVLILQSCGTTAKKEEENAEESEQMEGQAEVTITKQQFDAINIQLGSIEQKNLTDVLRVTGFLKVPPQYRANISAISGGTVQTILVQEGDYVQKGQTLATLMNPEFIKMQQEYLDAIAQNAFTEAEYNRQKELSEKNVSAQKTFQQAESNYHSLKAKISSLKQQLTLLGINSNSLTPENISSAINIKSPINGNISHIDINIGSTVDPSSEIMDVVDNSQLHLDLFIYEQDLMKVKIGQTVNFTLTNLPGKSFSAKIFAVGNAFENETKTIAVHASIPGDKTGLIEGMNVTASINIGNNFSPAVLSSAISNYEGNDFIFVQTEEKESGDIFSFQKIQVKKGVTGDGFTEITPLTSIPDNPKVVTNGSFYLMAMLTNAGEEE